VLAGTLLPAEIVVADQSDPPGPDLGLLVDGTPVRLVHLRERSRGLSRNRNAGIRVATGQRLAFIDDDVVVEPDWLAAFERVADEHGPSVVLSGLVDTQAHGEGDGFAPSLIVRREPVVHRGRPRDSVLFGGNLLLDRSILERVGPFDERLGAGSHFPSAEDNDLGTRILEAGLAIRYTPEAVVRHLAWRPWSEHTRLRWDYGRGEGAYHAKHVRRADPWMLRRFARLAARIGRRVPPRLRQEPRLALGDAAFVLGMSAGFLEWLVVERLRPGRPW
jgi:GT2 family glycosyltransferase